MASRLSSCSGRMRTNSCTRLSVALRFTVRSNRQGRFSVTRIRSLTLSVQVGGRGRGKEKERGEDGVRKREREGERERAREGERASHRGEKKKEELKNDCENNRGQMHTCHGG